MTTHKSHGRTFRLVALSIAYCVTPGPTASAQVGVTADTPAAAQSVIPQEYASPRSVLRTFLQRMAKNEKNRAAELLDLSGLSQEAASASGSDLAYKLFVVMQRLVMTPGGEEWPPKNEQLAFINVPDNPDFAGPWSLAQLELNPNGGADEIQIVRGVDLRWRFSAETVAVLDELYDDTEDQQPLTQAAADVATTEPISVRIRRFFPEWMRGRLLLIPTYQWVCLLFVAGLGIAVQRFTRALLTGIADWVLHRAEPDLKESTTSVWGPLARLANAATWYWGAYAIGLPLSVVGVLLVVLKLMTVVAAVWAAYAVIDLAASTLRCRAKSSRRKFDDLAVPLAATTMKVLAAVVGVLAVVAAFSEELPKTLIGGLGIGGVALALASQDTLSNFFGSVMVLLDRPFEVGDWIVVDGIEGEIESVGFRSTRIRTGMNSQVTLPNSKLASAGIDNWGRRRYRRYLTRLGVEYGTTPERIEAFCEGIRELIRRQPHTRKDFYAANLNEFGPSSLEVLMVVFFEVPDWATELRERHRLLADIMRLAEQLEVVFAFPTQTLHVVQEGASAEPKQLTDAELAGQAAAAEVAGELLNYQDRPGRVKFTGPHPGV